MSAGLVPAVDEPVASPSAVLTEDPLELLTQRRRGGAPRGTHRMAALCHELGDPQVRLPTIHVAGTDGKTSTVRIIASLLHALGYRSGETTSPHLQDVTERIRIGGVPVARTELLAHLPGLEAAIERAETGVAETVTFFEAITALALRVFEDRQVDAAVVEAGIGGRGDASNIVRARVSVLSRIGLDHVELGSSLHEIATEKAGIVEPGSTLITSAQLPEAARAIEGVVTQRGASLLRAGRDFGVLTRRPIPGGQLLGLRGLDGSYLRGRLPLTGQHQAANAAVALAAVQRFLGTTDLDPAGLRAGLAAVSVPGRVEVIRPHEGPPVVLDGAHDLDAVRALLTAVREALQPASVTLILGTSGARDPEPLLAELDGLAPSVIVTQAATPTSTPVEELAERLRCAGRMPAVAIDPTQALGMAVRETSPDGLVIVTGSLHLVGEVRSVLTDGHGPGP